LGYVLFKKNNKNTIILTYAMNNQKEKSSKSKKLKELLARED
jgi:hypothetical protein